MNLCRCVSYFLLCPALFIAILYNYNISVNGITVYRNNVRNSALKQLEHNYPISTQRTDRACGVDLNSDSKLWRSSRYHEVVLPVLIVGNCTVNGSFTDMSDVEHCMVTTVSWNKTIEIQHGDSLLIVSEDNYPTDNRKTWDLDITSPNKYSKSVHELTPPAARVKRQASDICSTKGASKLPTRQINTKTKDGVSILSDALTEGVHYLLVIFPKWNNHCFMLTVKVKPNICGETKNCNSNGACFTNNAMDSYKCQCCLGYTGDYCEHTCSPVACNGDEKCVKEEYLRSQRIPQCGCPYGYKSSSCEEEHSDCQLRVCLNGGECIDKNNKFQCICPSGYTGKFCEKQVNPCIPDPCEEKYYCVVKGFSYECVCRNGLDGQMCTGENNKSPCTANLCKNGGTCFATISVYVCICTRGFSGDLCEVHALERISGSTTANSTYSRAVATSRAITFVVALLGILLLIAVLLAYICNCGVRRSYRRHMTRTSQIWDRRSRVPYALRAPRSRLSVSDIPRVQFTRRRYDSNSSGGSTSE